MGRARSCLAMNLRKTVEDGQSQILYRYREQEDRKICTSRSRAGHRTHGSQEVRAEQGYVLMWITFRRGTVGADLMWVQKTRSERESSKDQIMCGKDGIEEQRHCSAWVWIIFRKKRWAGVRPCVGVDHRKTKIHV